MKRIRLFVILMFILICCSKGKSVAQEYLVNDHNAKTTESSNLSQGRENIEITLTSLPFGGTTLPVTISYTATPARYGDLPGLTGHNWNLNFQYHMTTRSDMFETEDPDHPLNSMDDLYDSQYKKSYNHVDFNTPSGKGTFLYGNGSTRWLGNYREKFLYVDNGYLSQVIIDDRGWRYLFGDSLVHSERLSEKEKDKGFEISSSLLKQIIAPNKDTLTITYGTRKLISPNKRLQILVQEAKDITPQFNYNDAIVKVDTVSVSEKKVYYPIRAQSSSGDYLEFNYTVSNGSILLESVTSSSGTKASRFYMLNNNATLLSACCKCRMASAL